MNFDLHKLKKRPAYPFETIAVGLGFSPRSEQILLEAKRIADACNAKLIIIHVGEKTPEREKQMGTFLFNAGIQKEKTKTIWAEGEVVDCLLKLCKLNIVDLLVLGALEKENIIKFYLGSIARTVTRRAKCSVLLLTREDLKKSKQKVIVNAAADHPKTEHTVNTALYLAKNIGVSEVTLVHELHSPGLAMTMAADSSAPQVTKIKKEFTEEESNKLHNITTKCDNGLLKINEKVVKGKNGYAVRKYAETKKADLLVINSPDTHLTVLDRIFTHDIEYILADIPCNLLIVHSRV